MLEHAQKTCEFPIRAGKKLILHRLRELVDMLHYRVNQRQLALVRKASDPHAPNEFAELCHRAPTQAVGEVTGGNCLRPPETRSRIPVVIE